MNGENAKAEERKIGSEKRKKLFDKPTLFFNQYMYKNCPDNSECLAELLLQLNAVWSPNL